MTREEIEAHINTACASLANIVQASGQQSMANVLYSANDVCVITVTIVPAKKPGSGLVIPTPHTN